ncbi:MAG: nucleotidyltransferase family protein [Fimbriimonadales bacterium]
MSESLQARLPELESLCREFGVRRLWVFGSAAKDQLREDSDLDFALEFEHAPDGMGPLEQFFGLQRRLEELLGRTVDLVEWSGARNPFFRREVERTRRELYAA